jgi:hypothetical protein
MAERVGFDTLNAGPRTALLGLVRMQQIMISALPAALAGIASFSFVTRTNLSALALMGTPMSMGCNIQQHFQPKTRGRRPAIPIELTLLSGNPQTTWQCIDTHQDLPKSATSVLRDSLVSHGPGDVCSGPHTQAANA